MQNKAIESLTKEEAQALVAQWKENEECNDHAGNLLLIAENVGTEVDVAYAKEKVWHRDRNRTFQRHEEIERRITDLYYAIRNKARAEEPSEEGTQSEKKPEEILAEKLAATILGRIEATEAARDAAITKENYGDAARLDGIAYGMKLCLRYEAQAASLHQATCHVQNTFDL